jgi:hypothetical protein
MRRPPRSLRSLAGVAAACALAVAVAPGAQAASAPPPLPAAVVALAPALQPQGGGVLKFLGISIYDGWYWSDGSGWSLERPFALDLHYHRSLDGTKIAERSIEEIANLGLGSKAQRERWVEFMRGIFPDVHKGDRITGVHLPPATVRYFHNGRPIGDIVDREFARAFFGIWLDPRTSRRDFRSKLLTEQP